MENRMKSPKVIALSILTLITASIAGAATNPKQAEFVGSAKCISCHKEIYAVWKESRHTKIVQTLSAESDNVIGDWKGTLKVGAGGAPPGRAGGPTGIPGSGPGPAGMPGATVPPGLSGAGAGAGRPVGTRIPEATVRLNRAAPGIYQITLVDSKDATLEKTYRIALTYGGHQDKQRYLIRIGNRHYMAPIAWSTANANWGGYAVESWYNTDGSLKEPPVEKSFEMACAGCHVTGLELSEDSMGTYEASYMELAVGCERCHGPGSIHVASPDKSGAIINPAKLSYERAMDVCNQCHTSGVSQPGGKLGYPWNDADNRPYLVGEILTKYMVGGSYGNLATYGKTQAGFWHHWPENGHAAAQVTCFACHNPHGGAGNYQLKAPVYDNGLCLSCHGTKFSSLGKIVEHTKHSFSPTINGLSRCTSCHSTAASPVSGRFLEIIKPQAAVASNSCNGCHKEWAGDEAALKLGAEKYQSLFGK